MKFLSFLLLISSIGGSVFFLINKYEQKISSFHVENILLKKQLSKIQDQYQKLDSFKNDCIINFLTVDNHYGIIPKGSILYLSPYFNSSVLQKTSIAMEVGILEKVSVNDTIWYYVTLPIESNINCRGWINENSFSSISSSTTDIIAK